MNYGVQLKSHFLKRILTVVVFIISAIGFAQPDLVHELRKTGKENPASILARFESRNSFVTNSGVHINGIKVGANFGPNLNLGAGYHWMTKTSAERVRRNLDEPVESRLRMEYVSTFVEYRFYNKGRYSASMPLQLGFGTVSYRPDKDAIPLNKPILLYEVMLNGEVRFLKYLGAGAGLGYRLCLANNNAFGLRMNSPIYNIRFNVYFEELYHRLAD